jgi:hypothetical protein
VEHILGGLILLFLALSFAIVGNVNQVFTGTPTSRRWCALPVSIVSGQPILVGGVPGVAMDNYQAVSGGATVQFGGSFNLTVLGATVISPLTGKAVKPGDPVYADGGTLDGPTNVTYNFTIDANSGGVLFGHLDATSGSLVTSGQTDTAATVMLDKGL